MVLPDAACSYWTLRLLWDVVSIFQTYIHLYDLLTKVVDAPMFLFL